LYKGFQWISLVIANDTNVVQKRPSPFLVTNGSRFRRNPTSTGFTQGVTVTTALRITSIYPSSGRYRNSYCAARLGALIVIVPEVAPFV